MIGYFCLPDDLMLDTLDPDSALGPSRGGFPSSFLRNAEWIPPGVRPGRDSGSSEMDSGSSEVFLHSQFSILHSSGLRRDVAVY